MDSQHTEADEADAFAYAQFPHARLLQVDGWAEGSALANWSLDNGTLQVDHLDAEEHCAVSVHTIQGRSGKEALRRLHAQSILERRSSEYRATDVGDLDAMTQWNMTVDGRPEQFARWSDSGESWWLVGEFDECTVVVRGNAGVPPIDSLRTVSDLRTLLEGRRARLGLPRD